MKKYLLSAVILLAALTVQAQKSVKITPTLKVGMQKTYITRGEATTSGSAAADITGELVYKVDGKTANGYQISMVSKSTNIDANQVMQSLTTPDLMQMLNSIRVELLTDKKGAVTAIGNSEEVLGKCMAVIDSMFNATIAKSAELKNNPEAAATMQKSMGIMKEMFTENYLLESYTQTPGITMLNGKTITDGMVEEGMFSPFFKTRTTYSLQNDGKTIVQVTEGDIDMESVKTYMSRMLSAMLPQQRQHEDGHEAHSHLRHRLRWLGEEDGDGDEHEHAWPIHERTAGGGAERVKPIRRGSHITTFAPYMTILKSDIK